MPVYMNVDDLIEAVTNLSGAGMARLLANWLTVLRNCNVLIHFQVQSPSHFHQLAGVSFPPPLLPFYPLAPFTTISPRFPTLYSQSLQHLLSQTTLLLSVSPWFFRCVHYSSSPVDTAKEEGTVAPSS